MRSGLALICLLFLSFEQVSADGQDGRDFFIGTSGCVLFGEVGSTESRSLPVGTRVFAYMPNGIKVEGKISALSTIGHPSNEEDKFSCGTITFADPKANPPAYYLVSTSAFPDKRPASKPIAISTLQSEQIKREIKKNYLNILKEHFYWSSCEENVSKEEAFRRAVKRAKFVEQYSYIVFPSSKGTIVVAALKKVDTSKPPNECEFPLFFHEVMGFELGPDGKIASSGFSIRSLSGLTGGDGTHFLMEYSPQALIDTTVLGVFDLGGTDYVFLLYQEGAESSAVSAWRWKDGLWSDLHIDFVGGL